MNKKLYNAAVVVMVVGIVGIFTVPAFAASLSDEANITNPSRITELEEQIQILEQKVLQKDLIISEQIKVILDLAKDYNPVYEGFSLEKFPETGGFNPAWLEGEREKILKNCNEAAEMGYTNNYCKYLQ